MVVGVPSAEWGSEVVCLYAGRADEGELREHVRERVEAHEVPKRFVPVDHIPTTELGKPDRGEGRRIAMEI
jgi:acyl-CoA synthetase (AMP-forming)/AMP-acid ligase II